MNFKIIDTIGNDTVVEFTFDDNTKSIQTIAGVPLDIEASTVSFLTDYGNAYLAGKEAETKTVDQSLIGKVLTPSIEAPVTGV